MYQVTKTLEISCSHVLKDHPGACARLHGHNYHIEVCCQAEALNEQGMVTDFGLINEIVNKYDHRHLNEFPEFEDMNPTAENIAYIICQRIPNCIWVSIEETGGNKAEYYKEGYEQ